MPKNKANKRRQTDKPLRLETLNEKRDGKSLKDIGGMIVKSSGVKSRDKNKIAVLLFVVVSFIYIFAWKYFDLPHDTSIEFIVRGISISILSILTTWLILKLTK